MWSSKRKEREFNRSIKRRVYMKKYWKAYLKTDKGKKNANKARKKYESKSEVKAKKSKRTRIWRINYRSRPDIQRKEKLYREEYRLKPEVREHQKVYMNKNHLKYHYAYKYGITPEDVKKMLKEQNGRCEICHVKLRIRGHNEVDRISIDHDHNTGKVRDLLCRKCNAGLGMFNDDPKLLRSVFRYFKKHSKS